VRNVLRPGDPRQLGGYELLSRLGEGGMGSVYLGRSPTGRLVAIKVIRAEFADEDEFRARFRSEVTRARQVPPFCTAEVLDADPEHRTPYLVVEYVDGPTLAEVVDEQGPLAAGNLHSVAIGVATALTAIHGAGVIHRDLKPRNVLFSLGTPKVIDFGIARALEVTSQHTKTDQMVGTVAYMSPERFDGNARAITPAADVFAWGAVVAYAASGRTPFAADSAAATAARILTQPPSLPGLTGQLKDLVALTLEKEPQNRPSAHELLDLLLATGPQEIGADLARNPALRRAAEAAQHSGRYQTGEGLGERATVVLEPKRPRRTGKLVLSGLGVLLAAAGAGAFVANRQGGGELAPQALSSATPSAPKTTTSRITRGVTIVDPLDRSGQWKTSDTDYGHCVYRGGALVASTGWATDAECPGPTDTFAGDQSIAVDVSIGAASSCAQIWFRFVADSGYLASACEKEVRLQLDDNDETRVLSKAPATLPTGSRHRLAIEVHDNLATLSIDGAPLTKAAVDDPTLAAGKVILGVSGTDLGDTGIVAYSHVEIKPL